MTKLLAYHGKQEIKDKYKQRMIDHINMDELIQGTGFEDGKGCFVGCTLNSYDHSGFEKELGVPEELAQLSDSIFEGLKKEEAIEFSKQWHDQIKVGADLSMVWPKMAVELLSNADFGVIQYVQKEEFKQQKKAIECVLHLYIDWVSTGVKPRNSEWAAAEAAAEAAARAAARAAWATVRAAAWAAWAAWATVRDAVWATVRATVRAARAAAWVQIKDKFFELLNECEPQDKE